MPACKWWRTKADEIYRAIPDFGGFVVKANSEGQPGPQDYGRSHADGANMLADAVAPHGGIIMWRAFVYSHEQPDDRAKQAYSEFVPLDGKFRENVLLQVKNGAIDFQPREPFHPLFGAMPRTPTDDGAPAHQGVSGLRDPPRLSRAAVRGSADVRHLREGQRLDGREGDRRLAASAIGAPAWPASRTSARIATGPARSSIRRTGTPSGGWRGIHRSTHARIAEEWVRMTFSNDAEFIEPVVRMMIGSREAVVDYMTPLGLHHLMERGYHYGPGPWVAGGRARTGPPSTTTAPMRRASASIVRRPEATRSRSTLRRVAKLFGNVDTVPEKYLLWFHHVPWDRKLASGRTLWDELVIHYTRGVDTPFARCARRGQPRAIHRRRALSRKSRRSSRFRRRKRSGGGTRASPTSRRSRSGRCRPATRRPRSRSLNTKPSRFPRRPGCHPGQ